MDTLISVDEALARLLSVSQPSRVNETALLLSADGVLADDVVSQIDTPPFDRAMLDGFAVRAKDVEGSDPARPTVLRVTGDILAGAGVLPTVTPGTAVRTMTGARLAHGADAIVRLEWARETRDADGQRLVEIYRSVAREEAVQRQGEGGRALQTVARAGQRLTPLMLGRLGSQGVASVSVYERPVVGVLTVGDELASLGTSLETGQVYDSNAVMLHALIEASGATARHFSCVRDDEVELQAALAQAVETCAAVITVGGVSVGDRDLTPLSVEALGAQRLFWGVWMRPGTPVYAGVCRSKPVLCCSGNPFAAWVNAVVFGWPMLEALQGLQAGSRQWVLSARVKHSPVLRRLKHTRYLQAVLTKEGTQWWADLGGSHSSALVPPPASLTGLVRVDGGQDVRDGDWVDVLFTQM